MPEPITAAAETADTAAAAVAADAPAPTSADEEGSSATSFRGALSSAGQWTAGLPSADVPSPAHALKARPVAFAAERAEGGLPRGPVLSEELVGCCGWLAAGWGQATI